MKKIQLIGALAISMSVIACGGDAKTTDKSSETTEAAEVTANTVNDYIGMKLADLEEFGVYASLQIPDGEKGPVKIENSATESVEIISGNSFGIEIIPFGVTVTEKKAELDNDLVYTIEYLEDSPEKIVYKKTIKDSEVEPEFHFFLTKEINGESYSIQSLNKAFKQRNIEKMVVSAESLTASNPA